MYESWLRFSLSWPRQHWYSWRYRRPLLLSGLRRPQPLTPRFSTAVAFDVSPALRSLPRIARPWTFPPDTILEVRPERRRSEGLQAHRSPAGHNADGVSQLFSPTPTIPAPLLTFEGMSNQDNFNIFGFRVNPPDPNRRCWPESLRGDDQSRLCGFRQGRQFASGPD